MFEDKTNSEVIVYNMQLKKINRLFSKLPCRV